MGRTRITYPEREANMSHHQRMLPNLLRSGGDPGPLMLAVDRKERIARISLVGPAERMPEILPLPASGEGSFNEGGLRVVWSEVPIAQVARAAQGVHAALMAPASV